MRRYESGARSGFNLLHTGKFRPLRKNFLKSGKISYVGRDYELDVRIEVL